MANIYSRWGQKVGSTEKWLMLKNRLKVVLGDDFPDCTKDEARLIAFTLGKDLDAVSGNDGLDDNWYIRQNYLLDSATTPFELAQVLEAMFQHLSFIQGDEKLLADVVNSADCGIKINKTKDGWISYPAGEKLLDDELVEKSLSFLSGGALREFTRAIEHYSAHKWEECSEKTRRTLEEYLRFKLNTNKGLDAAIVDLSRKVDEIKDFPVHLKNSIIGLLKILDKNYNEASKHHSKTYSEQECEFLIYETGILLRLLNGIEFNKGKK